MRRVLIAVAVTALMGGLVVAPVTEQTAGAGFSGLKAAGTAPGGSLVTLVRRGGGGHGGGGHGGGHMRGGGHGGGGHALRGGGHRGGGHVYRGGGHYRGGHYRGRRYAAPKHYYHRGGGHKNKHYTYKYRRYYPGRYYRNYGWYGWGWGYAYGYGGCAWLRRQALITGSSYWWQRYYDCIYY